MTFQTSLTPVPEQLERQATDELYTPLPDAVGARAQQSVRGWIPARMMFNAEVDEAQNGRKVGRFGGRYKPDSRVLELAEAQRMVAEAGVRDRVEVTEGMRERALKLRIERALEDQRLEQLVSHADPSAGTQFLIAATGVAVDFADPVNVGTMLIPGVGAAKVTYGLAKVTAELAPIASKLIVRAGTGAYEGAVSTALAEPLNAAVHQSLGDDYGWADSAENIITNAVAGGAIHALGGLGLDLYRGMRLRPEAGPEGTVRVVEGGAEQFGSLEPVDVSGLPSREPAPAPAQADAVAPSAKKRTGEGYAQNSILMMHASGASGERVTLYDLATFNAVRREYEPVRQAGTESTVADVYRIERDGDILVYTQSPKVKGSPTTYTVERLRADDAAEAPLSTRRAASAASSEADSLLYLHPSKALAERFAETLETTVTALERLSPEELLRFQPSVMKGDTIDAEIGDYMHDSYRDYGMGGEELDVPRRQARAQPDSGVPNTELFIDLKRDSPRGRRSGQETNRKYRLRLNRDTAILLYDVKPYEGRIAALDEKVVKAWDQFRPNWRAELAAKKEAQAKAKAEAKARVEAEREPKPPANPQPKPQVTQKPRKAVNPRRTT